MSEEKKLLDALGSVLTREQLSDWRKQREGLRSNFRQMWEAFGDTFRTIWEADEEVFPREAKLAALFAAKEDTDDGNAMLVALSESLLPEFYVAADSYLEEQKEDGEGKTEETTDDSEMKISVDVCELMELCYNKRDVETNVFSFENWSCFLKEMEKEDTDDEKEEKIKATMEGIHVVRSCLLLHFVASLLLVVVSQCKEFMEQDHPES